MKVQATMMKLTLLFAVLSVVVLQVVAAPSGVVPLPPMVETESAPYCFGKDDPSSIVFLLDLEKSVEGTVGDQLSYTTGMLAAFGWLGSTATRFGISAYSKYTNVVRSLGAPESNDVTYVAAAVDSKDALKNTEWHSSGGGYEFLMRGERFSSISRALKNTGRALAQVQDDKDTYGELALIVLFTDGHPRNHEHRYSSTNGVFWKSLAEAKEARESLEQLNMKTHVHCVMIQPSGFFTQIFFSGSICDTQEELGAAEASTTIYECGVSADIPSVCQENVCN